MTKQMNSFYFLYIYHMSITLGRLLSEGSLQLLFWPQVWGPAAE